MVNLGILGTQSEVKYLQSTFYVITVLSHTEFLGTNYITWLMIPSDKDQWNENKCHYNMMHDHQRATLQIRNQIFVESDERVGDQFGICRISIA